MSKQQKHIMKRMQLVYFSLAFLAILIFGKTMYIQIVNGSEMKEKAEEQSIKYITIDATRGNIYAIDGSLIATSVPIFEVRLDLDSSTIKPKIFDSEIDSLAYYLTDFFADKTQEKYKEELLEARKKQNRYYLLKRDLSYTELQSLKTFPILKHGRYKGGLIVVEKNRREMPFKLLAKRTIGYERNGVFVGIEGAYSQELQGSSGKRLVQRIANNVWMPINDNNEITPQHGNDIITTIDINIQDVAETALYEHLELHQADHGCVVLMEVETGEIRAIANLTRLEDGTYAEIYNWAVGESTEPGSTFKLASLMAVFEDGLFGLNDLVNTGDGTITYAGQEMKDTHIGGYGTITVKEAFEKSSNVGISKIIYKAYHRNPQKYIDKLYDMHLNEKLGIEIMGEGDPFIKNTQNSSWSKVSLPWMAIGYELTLTPLQILSFYNAVANNGTLVKPMFVKEIRQAGETIKNFETIVIDESIASESTIEKAKILLEGVVTNGTAKSVFKNSPYSVAGKTATAQIVTDKGYNKKNYQASFVGYFPADNPKYSCIVVVNNPTMGSYYGSIVAAPVFREIADKVTATHADIQIDNFNFSNVKYPSTIYGYSTDLKTVYSELGMIQKKTSVEEQWSSVIIKNKQASFYTKTQHTNILPNLLGMTAKDAIYILEKLGYNVRVKGRGKVYKQSVKAGSPVVKGKEIRIYLKAS